MKDNIEALIHSLPNVCTLAETEKPTTATTNVTAESLAEIIGTLAQGLAGNAYKQHFHTIVFFILKKFCLSFASF